MKENPDYTREQAEGTCGKIEKQTKKKDAPRTEAERAMAHFNIGEEEWEKLSDEEKQKYIDRLPPRGSGREDFKTSHVNKIVMETIKETLRGVVAKLDDLVEEEYQGNSSNTTLSERAKKFFNLSDDQWNELTEDEKKDYISKLPPEKVIEGSKEEDSAPAEPSWSITKDEFHELPLERKIAFLYLVDCSDCLDEWEIDGDTYAAVKKLKIETTPPKPVKKKEISLPETRTLLDEAENALKKRKSLL